MKCTCCDGFGYHEDGLCPRLPDREEAPNMDDPREFDLDGSVDAGTPASALCFPCAGNGTVAS